MSKILNNLPVEDLSEDNDYLGIIDKGQIIKTFLESNTEKCFHFMANGAVGKVR
jgi:hypothetical protein